jgi:hypothetical protein
MSTFIGYLLVIAFLAPIFGVIALIIAVIACTAYNVLVAPLRILGIMPGIWWGTRLR